MERKVKEHTHTRRKFKKSLLEIDVLDHRVSGNLLGKVEQSDSRTRYHRAHESSRAQTQKERRFIMSCVPQLK